jgi:hypothetical protein
MSGFGALVGFLTVMLIDLLAVRAFALVNVTCLHSYDKHNLFQAHCRSSL